MKTDDLIQVLAADQTSKPAIATSYGFAIVTAFAFVGAAITFLVVFGLRENLSSSAVQQATAYKLLFTLGLSAAALATLWQVRQPVNQGRLWLVALVFLAIAAFGIVLDQIFPTSGSFFERAKGLHPWLCLLLVPVISAVPLALFITLMRSHAPANPGRAGMAAGLSAAAIGASFYALGCTNDSPLFVLTWYSIAGLITTAAGYVAGKRFLNW
jgi:hypothetical protein